MQYLDYNGLSTFKSLLDKIYPKLDDNNKIPSSYLPSYVDDVLEFDTESSFPTTGESGKIYLTADTNKSYRWTGSGYAEISSSLALGETSATAYRGDRGKIAYDHSQKSHSLTIAGNSVSALGGTLTKDALLTSLGLSSAASDITSLKAHVANGDIHVTADDKTTWNSAVETLNTHTKDTTIHITSDERTKWNNNITNLSTHIADSTKHITASERKAWNAKWDYNEATIKAVKVNNATTADKVGHTITFADGTTFNGSADKSIGKAQVGLDKVENKTITVTSSSVSDGTNTFNKYIHPTHSAVTIASADGRVLGNISVDSLGHVTSVGYKALGFADIPSLYIGKTKVQSSAKAQALTGISSITLEGSTAELKWDNDKTAWRLSGNLLVDGFVASGGTGTSGGSSGGAVDVSYVANLTAGTLLGTLTINGTDYQILAPSLTASSINAALGNTPVARATADAEGNSISGTYAKTSALPTKVSQLTNDSGYLTAITKSMVERVLTGNITSHTHSQYITAHQSISLASGTNNGTLKLTVGSTTTDNIAVKGLGSAAYTDSSAYAAASHTHTFASLTEKPTTISGYGIKDSIYLLNGSGSYVGARSNYGENMTGDKYLEWWNSAGWVHHKAGKYSVQGGTSSQFLKADGSLDNTAYFPLKGGAINGYLQIGAIGNTSYNHLVLFRSGRFARINNTPTDAYFSFGTVSDTGALTAEKVLQLGDNGLKYSPDNSSYYNILHSGNYNSYSPKLDGTGATGTWGIDISGNAATATKLGTSNVGSQYKPVYINSGTPTEITSFPEAYLSWGGKNHSASYGPIDAAMIPDLGACRSTFARAAGIDVQYSRDGGATWIDYGLTDYQKTALFSVDTPVYIGGSSGTGIDKSNYKLRVILTTNLAGIYTTLNKIAINLATNGSTGSNVTIDARTKANVDAGNDTWATLANSVAVAGWSGWNIINIISTTTYGRTSSQYQQIRFTFGVTSHPSTVTSAGLLVFRIMLFGGVGWDTPSNMARNGHLYSFDASQNATFPANVTVNGSLRASSLSLNGSNLLEWDESNSAWKFNGNLIATGFIASGDISAQAAALAEEEDRIAALEAQVAELQAEIETLKAS